MQTNTPSPYRKRIKMNKQTKWLVGLVALLMIANIGLVATIWLKKDEAFKAPHGDARNYLVKTLELNEEQVKAFDSLREKHFERINNKRRMIAFLKDRLFGMLSENQNSQTKNELMTSLFQKLSELQEDIDKDTFEHFSQLRQLLNDKQKQKFDTTIQQLLRNLGPLPEGGQGPPPPDFRNPPPPNGLPENGSPH